MAYTEFGLWLDRKMREAGITSQSELGRQIGKTHATINRWMSGVSEPTPKQVVQLCRLLGVAPLEAYYALRWLPKMPDSEWPNWEQKLARLSPGERERLSAVADLYFEQQERQQAIAGEKRVS